MASSARLEWNGDAVIAQVEEAARDAVNDTVDAAAEDARGSHVWVNRNMQLEDSIVTEHARLVDPNPLAKFGTTRRRGFYGLFHEIGTVHEHERPFLRPAGDRHFGSLAARIRRRLAA